MKPAAFLLERPCPCSCTGYLEGLNSPESRARPPVPEVNAEVIGPILRWQERVLAGKDVPSETECRFCLCYTYKLGRKPKRKPAGPPAPAPLSMDEVVDDSPADKTPPKPPPTRSRFGPPPEAPKKGRFG